MVKVIQGNYNSIKVFASIIESNAIKQLQDIADNSYYKDCIIRVMPDTHSGKECVVGFTMQFKDVLNPNLVGSDIGCGMLVYPIKEELNLDKFDSVVQSIVNKEYTDFRFDYSNMVADVYNDVHNSQLGTLGRGNHFIEIDKGKDCYYIVVHTGSRRLGHDVCNYYNALTKDGMLFGQDVKDYLNDMRICQVYADYNRIRILTNILSKMDIVYDYDLMWTCLHNYIDNDNMLRKGSISAKLGEKVIIPLNMRDGCIIGVGKGNVDWNYSAPHGAGRVLSRGEARRTVSLDDYKMMMQGIYTNCISENTIDESPVVYKNADVILEDIKDTVDVVEIVKPIYNFKNN